MATAADLVKQGYSGYQGWGDAEANADFQATGGKGKGGPSQTGAYGIPDPIEQAKKLQEFQVQANQPAIQSLQQSIPEIGQRYDTTKGQLQGQIEPLKQRYQSIIDDLTRRQGVAETSATRNTATEFSRRGVPLSSGMYANELEGALNPIRSEYATLSRDTGLSREDAIRSINDAIAQLTGQQTTEQRAVQNAIAQLQAGNPSSAIQGALSYIGQLQQAQQAQQQQELARQELEAQKSAQAASQAFQEKTYQNIDLPSALANIANINSLIGERGKSSGAGNIDFGAEYRNFVNQNNNSNNYVTLNPNQNKYAANAAK